MRWWRLGKARFTNMPSPKSALRSSIRLILFMSKS